MILSVSRRTDIPSFYSDWFFERLKEGFVYTRNPMNPKQVSRLELSTETVDCMVFWTKNPAPMLERLSELEAFAAAVCAIAKENGMVMASCSEEIDLSHCGIAHNACIDKALIEDIIGCKLKGAKDRNQRKECGCMESIDIGTYHTCANGCVYCYANHSDARVREARALYDVHSPILCGRIGAENKVTERKAGSLKAENG